MENNNRDAANEEPSSTKLTSGELSTAPVEHNGEPRKRPPRSERKRQLRLKKLEDQKLCRLQKRADKRKLQDEGNSAGCGTGSQAETATQDDNGESTRNSNCARLNIEEGEHISKKRKIELMRERQKEAMSNGQKIVIDCSLEKHMSNKECGKLAQQLCRLYGHNRRSDNPAHLYFTGFAKSGHLFSECVRKNAGFENYMVDMTEEHHSTVFPTASIVCLSPDSSNPLTSVEKDKVYVIGGLVDEHVQKGKSISSAESLNIATARLPLDEYMEKTEDGTFKKVLTVNQVFGILLTFAETGDWRTSLKEWVPVRHGFRLKTDISS